MMRVLFLIMGMCWAAQAFAGDIALKTIEKAPPKELDASFTKALSSKALQVLAGDTTKYEFWFVSEVPLTGKPHSVASGLQALKETTFMGVVNLPTPQRDYRDNEIAAGIYTMRYALQPEDGDHLGTSDYNYYIVLTPAKIDNKLDGLSTYKALVKASGRETASNHPVILSLRPPTSETDNVPKLEEPAPEHKSVRLKLPAKASGESTSLMFDLIVDGKAKK